MPDRPMFPALEPREDLSVDTVGSRVTFNSFGLFGDRNQCRHDPAPARWRWHEPDWWDSEEDDDWPKGILGRLGVRLHYLSIGMGSWDLRWQRLKARRSWTVVEALNDAFAAERHRDVMNYGLVGSPVRMDLEPGLPPPRDHAQFMVPPDFFPHPLRSQER